MTAKTSFVIAIAAVLLASSDATAQLGNPNACEPHECILSLIPDAEIVLGNNCNCDEACSFFGDCCANACSACGSCGQICGDGACYGYENPMNCPLDCAVCGDGVCQPVLEDINYCPQDC